MAALAELVSWGAAAESKLVRAALVRLCVRAGSLGGGMSPFLVPLVSILACGGLCRLTVMTMMMLAARETHHLSAATTFQLE